jgi:DnaJ-class molecular chaperone
MKMQSEFPDYYKCLGLPFGAGNEEIKHRFRNLAKTFHPDNQITGSVSEFEKILRAYQILTSKRDRAIYDYAYFTRLSQSQKSLEKFPIVTNIPVERIQFATSVLEFAKKGLMRKGYRMKDRRKWTGIQHDVEVFILPQESEKVIRIQIPLTVRTICPNCLGSDLHCESCGGSGSYKSSRNLVLDLLPNQWRADSIMVIDLSKHRPDKFTHFKKNKIKLLLKLQSLSS